MMIHNRLLIIDPQSDFVDPAGSLFVNGADTDIVRLASFVRRNAAAVESIHVTMDTHSQLQIFHPLFWQDRTGNSPQPFTGIRVEDVESGVWTARREAARGKALEYVRALRKAGRFSLVIWPCHCLVGSRGAAVQEALFSELCAWERLSLRSVDYVRKGTNEFTEHYSALKAEVEDPDDIGTRLNERLVRDLSLADCIYVAGEALDYCVYNTVRDLADALAAQNAREPIPAIRILEDCTSPIDAASAAGIKREFETRGIRFVSSGEALAKELP